MTLWLDKIDETVFPDARRSLEPPLAEMAKLPQMGIIFRMKGEYCIWCGTYHE